MREALALALLFGWRPRRGEGAPEAKVEAELEPIEPGAWAAWARERERELAAAAPNRPPARTREPRPRAVTASRLEMRAAVYPRGYGLRMRR